MCLEMPVLFLFPKDSNHSAVLETVTNGGNVINQNKLFYYMFVFDKVTNGHPWIGFKL